MEAYALLGVKEDTSSMDFEGSITRLGALYAGLYALLFIGLGAIFDVFDGAIARMLNVSGKLGMELDSLSDVVTFGLAPVVAAYVAFVADEQLVRGEFSFFLVFLLAIFPMCASYRLARFNLTTTEEKDFEGLPTPAAGLALASLLVPKWSSFDPESKLASPMFSLLNSPYLLVAIALMLGMLMVSKVSFFSLKSLGNPLVKTYGTVLVISAILLIITLGWAGISYSFFAYIALSIIYSFHKASLAK